MAMYYPGARLDRESWGSFQEHVYRAYNDFVAPLLHGVTPPIEIELARTRGARDTTDSEKPPTATCAYDPAMMPPQRAGVQQVSTV